MNNINVFHLIWIFLNELISSVHFNITSLKVKELHRHHLWHSSGDKQERAYAFIRFFESFRYDWSSNNWFVGNWKSISDLIWIQDSSCSYRYYSFRFYLWPIKKTKLILSLFVTLRKICMKWQLRIGDLWMVLLSMIQKLKWLFFLSLTYSPWMPRLHRTLHSGWAKY